MTPREKAMVLAALRNWQVDCNNDGEDMMAEMFSEHFEDHEPLTLTEIDDLCERINS